MFVDLRKAFDTVDHKILISKLEYYGIKGANLLWCKNYLSSRSQCTLANGDLSSRAEVTFGVPQGSVLGPLFFILYVNDVQEAIKGAEIQMYADDTVLYASDHNELQKSLDQFTKWCSGNKLSLNVSKTKQMVFGTRNMIKKARTVQLKIKGLPLQTVPTYKYLGITLDSALTLNYHVKSVAGMISHKAILLGKIRKFLTEKVALKMYKSMILPYFDYGDVIYNNTNQDGLDKLQRLQNRICKGYNVRYDTENLHSETKILQLKTRGYAHVNNFMYTRIGDQHYVDNREIRKRAHDAPLFKVKVPKLESYKRSVEYAGSFQWNNLPVEIRGINSHKLFKAKQKHIMTGTL